MEFERIKNIIADVLGADTKDIEVTSAFAKDFGADSLEIFQIMCRLEEDFDMNLTYEVMSGFSTIQDVIDYIRRENV